MSKHNGVIKSLLWSPLALGAWVAIAPIAQAQEPVMPTEPQAEANSELTVAAVPLLEPFQVGPSQVEPSQVEPSQEVSEVETVAAVSSPAPSAAAVPSAPVEDAIEPPLAEPVNRADAVDSVDSVAVTDVATAGPGPIADDATAAATDDLSTAVAAVTPPQSNPLDVLPAVPTTVDAITPAGVAADLSFNPQDGLSSGAASRAASSDTFAQRQVPPDQKPSHLCRRAV